MNQIHRQCAVATPKSSPGAMFFSQRDSRYRKVKGDKESVSQAPIQKYNSACLESNRSYSSHVERMERNITHKGRHRQIPHGQTIYPTVVVEQTTRQQGVIRSTTSTPILYYPPWLHFHLYLSMQLDLWAYTAIAPYIVPYQSSPLPLSYIPSL